MTEPSHQPRACSLCHRPDLRVIDRDSACSCLAADTWAPDDEHTPDCARVGHEVVAWPWPKVYRARDLVRDATATHGYRLPPGQDVGWFLREYRWDETGKATLWVRWRWLCRACIERETDRKARMDEYKRVSDARGGKGRTAGGWAQSVLAQDTL